MGLLDGFSEEKGKNLAGLSAKQGSTEKEAPQSRPSSSIDSSFVSGCT